jgi:hypothetical protein
MIRRLMASALFTIALPALAQQPVPAANYTDLWWTNQESGWGITFTQSKTSNNAWAIWYTYDPREPDPAVSGNYKPLWIVMSGGTWTSPTSITGPVYVLHGVPFYQSGTLRQPGNDPITQVGSFTFTFASPQSGTFTYNIQPPANLPASDPAFGLPPFSGTKTIERLPF